MMRDARGEVVVMKSFAARSRCWTLVALSALIPFASLQAAAVGGPWQRLFEDAVPL